MKNKYLVSSFLEEKQCYTKFQNNVIIRFSVTNEEAVTKINKKIIGENI